MSVTDVVAHHGVTAATEWGRLYGDTSYIELQVGGDDAKSGQHALYRFTGRSEESAPAVAGRCTEERKRRELRRAVRSNR